MLEADDVGDDRRRRPARESRSPQDGHTAVVQAGAADDPNEMVRAADDLKDPTRRARRPRTSQVNLTGASGMWSDFNQANKDAMMKSELISWPVTLAILVLAFGSLVAAGLPLMLTIIGLVAAAGSLYLGHPAPRHLDLGDELRADVRAGARDRLRALRRHPLPRRARSAPGWSRWRRSPTRWTPPARRCCSRGVTVLISLSAVMLVPSPAFRSMASGSCSRSLFVLAATLTLLPAVLAKLGPRVDKLGLPWVHSGEHRSPRFAAWGERLWRRPLLFGALALVDPDRADDPRLLA